MKKTLAAMLLGVSPLVFASPALAQPGPQNPPAQAVDEDEDENDEDGDGENKIVVTGTFIRGIPTTGNQVLGLSEEDVQATGGQSTNDVLATIPQLNNFFNSLNVIGQGGAGPASINQNAAVQVQRPSLRDVGGLTTGSSPTLLLMDGHRMVGAGVDQSSPDAGVIPPGVLERVEVITDGGSALYGSDAVGGVINFITRRRYDGIRINGRYGVGEDIENINVDLTIGTDWGSGSIFGAVSYSEEQPVIGLDRDWFSAVNWNPDAPFGRYLTGELRNCANPNVVVGSGATAVNHAVLSSTTLGAANSYNACDASDFQTISADQEALSFFGGLSQEIVEGVDLDIRGFHTHRKTVTGRGPLTATARVDDEVFTAAVGRSPYYIDVPGVAAAANGATQSVLFDFSPFNGTDAASNLTDLKTWGITGTLSVDLGSDWELNAIVNHGQSDTFYLNREVNTARLQYYATGNGAPGATACVFNLTPGAAGCNINPYAIASSNPAALADVVNWQRFGGAHQELTNHRAVFDGPVFSLPGGELRAAFGVEYIHQKMARRGGTTNFGDEDTLVPLSGDRNVTAFFGEVNIPIFGAENRMTLFESLTLSASVRHDRYSDFGQTTNPQVGFAWELADWFLVRGNWGQSFVAPSLLEVINQNFQLASANPFLPNWGGLTVPAGHTNVAGGSPFGVLTPGPIAGQQTVSITGAAPDLGPQTGEAWALGFDARAPFLPNLRFSLTYYHTKFEDTLSTFGNVISFGTQNNYNFWHPFIFINGVDGTGPNGAFTAADIAGFCAPAVNNTACAAAVANPGSVYILADLRAGNFGGQQREGLDFAVRYSHEFSWGTANAGISGNYRLGSSNRAPGATVFTASDLTNSSRYNATVNAGVTIGNFLARATMRYSDGYPVVFNNGNPVTPTSGGPFQDYVDAYYPVDLFFRYDFGGVGFAKNLQLTLNINNVADDDPPEFRQTGTFGTANGQSLGRVFALGATAEF